jgi:predicted HicB family RNase H-like nuclease
MSKFKIPSPNPASSSPAAKPAATVQDFVSGAALVQSQAGTRPPKPVRLNLDLDPDVHRQLKLRAVEGGVTIAQLVRALIKRELG